MPDKRTAPMVADFDPAEHLHDDADMAGYLRLAIEEGDPVELGHALEVVARARGMMDLAARAGLSREALYAALHGDGDTVVVALNRVCETFGAHE